MRARPIQEVLRLEKRPAFSMQCHIETESQQQIQALCADELLCAHEVIWVHGPAGVGKTHLAMQLQAQLGLGYFDCAEIPPMQAAILFDSLDLEEPLILDSVDRWLGPAGAEEALFSWWKRRQAGAVCIARVSPRTTDLFALPDLASRAVAAQVMPLQSLDDSDIERLWHCQLRECGIELSPEATRFLQPRLPRNPGRLMRLVAAMDQESLRDQRKITVPWLKRLLISLS